MGPAAINDDDDAKGYVRPLLQLETVTSVLVIRPRKQFILQRHPVPDCIKPSFVLFDIRAP